MNVMNSEEREELINRIKELEWHLKHLKDMSRINPLTGEWSNNYSKKGPEGPF